MKDFQWAWKEVERMLESQGKGPQSFHLRVQARNTVYDGEQSVSYECSITIFSPSCDIFAGGTWEIAVEMLACKLFPLVKIVDIAALTPEVTEVAA